MDEGKAVDVVFLDFSKAFDTVPHSILLDKFSSCGISRFRVHWVKTWLKACSEWGYIWLLPVISSIPQGSILGTVLFHIFINNLDAGVKCTISKAADDSKLGNVLDSLEDKRPCRGI